MLQKNRGPYSLDLPTLDPPVTVPPGGEIDHPTLLGGWFEPVPDKPKAVAPAKPAPAPVSPAAAAPDAKEA